MSRAAIETHALSKRYRSHIAVRGLSLRVERGQVFGLLGPNGAGKSTTLGMLTTLLHPSSGDAFVAGHSIKDHPRRVRASVGIVFQSEMLDLELTARQNLDIHARLHGVPAAERKPSVERALKVADVSTSSRQRVGTFSGGMRRRLEIARGLMHTPEVLFLDEPTIGLDIEARSLIWQEIERLRKRREVTIVLTTHYLEEADHLADVVAIIDDGVIKAQGTPDELKKTLGGDVVRASLEGITPGLTTALGNLQGMGSLDIAGQQVQLTIRDGETRVPELIKILTDHSTHVRSFRIEPPSLDDVFLKLTGHRIEGRNVEH